MSRRTPEEILASARRHESHERASASHRQGEPMSDRATPVEQNMAFGPPPPSPATRNRIREIEDMLHETGGDPEKVADWVNREIERRGAATAEPVFDMKGAGPSCSWCGALWPLCGHQHMSEVLDEPSKVNGWWMR